MAPKESVSRQKAVKRSVKVGEESAPIAPPERPEIPLPTWAEGRYYLTITITREQLQALGLTENELEGALREVDSQIDWGAVLRHARQRREIE